jgi:hypothetical protein
LTDNCGEIRDQLQHCPHICVLVFLSTIPRYNASASLLHSLSLLWASCSDPSSQPSGLYRSLLIPKAPFFSKSNWQRASDRSHSFQLETPSLPPPPTQYCVWGWFHKDLNTCVLHMWRTTLTALRILRSGTSCY